MYIIVDGSSIAHRAWHAKPISGFKNVPDEKEEVEAVGGLFIYSFCKQLVSIVKEVDKRRPLFSKVIICWDGRNSTKLRRSIYPEYKANRAAKKDAREHLNVYTFINLLRDELTRVSPRFSLYYEYAEADDLIGIICNTLGDENKVIVTRDKDMYQLVDNCTFILDPFQDAWLGENEIMQELGCTPKQIVEYKALVGDKSDNYPGMRGVGHKKALLILNNSVNYEVSNKEVNTFKKLATLPNPDLNTLEILETFCNDEFNKRANWEYLSKEWAFNSEFEKALYIVT
jgi:DNA polymerase-1